MAWDNWYGFNMMFKFMILFETLEKEYGDDVLMYILIILYFILLFLNLRWYNNGTD